VLAGAIAGCHGLPASRCPAAEPASKPPASPIATAFELDPETAAMLKEIDAVGAYGRLNLPLKIDANYAHTPSRYEPFGPFVGQPHKRHFLEQM
jgi:hypothetical protein